MNDDFMVKFKDEGGHLIEEDLSEIEEGETVVVKCKNGRCGRKYNVEKTETGYNISPYQHRERGGNTSMNFR